MPKLIELKIKIRHTDRHDQEKTTYINPEYIVRLEYDTNDILYRLHMIDGSSFPLEVVPDAIKELTGRTFLV